MIRDGKLEPVTNPEKDYPIDISTIEIIIIASCIAAGFSIYSDR